MKNPLHSTHSLSKDRLPVLDGLRFFAAFCVLLAHYVNFVVVDQKVNNSITNLFTSLSGIGMPLFFVLSGFVIHYNYHHLYTKSSGVKTFVVARFTRLYPLYIVLFVIEFAIAFHQKRGSCGQAGERWGFLLALPYYLTLTQDWVYGIIAQNNLIYQYLMTSAVSWSISLECFFYLSYLIIALWLIKQNNILKQILIVVILQIGVLIYLLYCHRFSQVIDHVALVGFGPNATTQHGYQDSLLRWLYYFNPLVNLPAFFFGTIIANIYLIIKDRPLHKIEQACAEWITCLSILTTLAVHFWLYAYLAPTHVFIGRAASVLDVPLIVVMIFCLVRYSSTALNKLFSLPILVKLGQASYSIYLLHAFFCWYPRDFYYLGLNPWLLYALSVISILVISRLSYVLFERPVQRFLRRKMLDKEEESSSALTRPIHSTAID